jgi:hypothetical protein
MRSLLVIVFVGAVAAGAGVLAKRPTIARGDVIAADLLAKNPATLRTITCDPEVPIGIDGASFACVAELASGVTRRLDLTLDRGGVVHEVGESAITQSDPWR